MNDLYNVTFDRGYAIGAVAVVGLIYVSFRRFL
jgi:hypothetical protein